MKKEPKVRKGFAVSLAVVVVLAAAVFAAGYWYAKTTGYDYGVNIQDIQDVLDKREESFFQQLKNKDAIIAAIKKDLPSIASLIQDNKSLRIELNRLKNQPAPATLADCLFQKEKLLLSLEYCTESHDNALQGNIGREKIIGIQSTLLTTWGTFYGFQQADYLRIKAEQAKRIAKEKKKKWLWSAVVFILAYITGSIVNG